MKTKLVLRLLLGAIAFVNGAFITFDIALYTHRF